MARRLMAIEAIRSDSFTRNSFASRISTPRSVYGAIAASTGISSINAAVSELAMEFFQLSDGNAQPHLHEDIEQARPRRIHQQISDGQLRARKERRGTKKERGTGQIAGHSRFNSPQTLSAANSDCVAL